MAAEREEVAVNLLDVHGHVRHALRRVDDTDRADLVCPLRDLLDGVDRPEDVRAVRDGDDLRPLRDQLVVILHPEGPVVRHPRPLQLHALVILDEEPRHVVRVVLHHGRDDLVARLQLPLDPPSVGDGIDALRRGLRERDLVRRAGVDELRDLFPGALIFACRFFPQFVDRPMDVRVVPAEEVGHGVDDGLGLLGRGGAVEVHEGFSTDRTGENREVFPDPFHVHEELLLRRHRTRLSVVPGDTYLLCRGRTPTVSSFHSVISVVPPVSAVRALVQFFALSISGMTG